MLRNRKAEKGEKRLRGYFIRYRLNSYEIFLKVFALHTSIKCQDNVTYLQSFKMERKIIQVYVPL